MLLFMQNIAVIIPCYNEVLRLQPSMVAELLSQNEQVFIFFTDDGSTDGTPALLAQIQQLYPGKIEIIRLDRNQGKGAAVFAGAQAAMKQNKFNFIGYLDADFSTPPEQFNRLFEKIKAPGVHFVFGSRLKTINRLISRKYYRHLFGRAITTIIDSRFRLGIYDTQCGAKIFSLAACKIIFTKPFVTKWLFDIEIFLRLRENELLSKGIEMPLEEWKDVKGSKLKFIHFPLIGWEIIKLFRNYKATR